MTEKYKLTFKEKPLTLDPDTFNPIKSLEIKLGLTYAAQQDGRPLSKDRIEELTKLLTQKVILEINAEIEKFIKEVNPYA